MSSWPKVKSATIDVEAGSHAFDLDLVNGVPFKGVRHTLPAATSYKAPLRVESGGGPLCLIHPEFALHGLGCKMGKAKAKQTYYLLLLIGIVLDFELRLPLSYLYFILLLQT